MSTTNEDPDFLGPRFRALNALMSKGAPLPAGTWGIEYDEGYEIAVMRDAQGRALAFMNPDDAREMGLVTI